MDANAAPDMLTVLQNVGQFYETSWNHLLVCGSVAVAIVGVVVPVLLQIYQTRTMRHEREEIRGAIASQVTAEMRVGMEKESALLAEKIAAATKSLEERLARDRAELEQKSRKTQEELQMGIQKTTGRVFGVQANTLINQHRYKAAAESIVLAMDYLRRGDDRINLRRQLVSLTETCLPTMTKTECEEINEGERGFVKVMAEIKEWDAKGDFQDVANMAMRAFKTAGERDSQKPTVK